MMSSHDGVINPLPAAATAAKAGCTSISQALPADVPTTTCSSNQP
jgi:hypothetical protein